MARLNAVTAGAEQGVGYRSAICTSSARCHAGQTKLHRSRFVQNLIRFRCGWKSRAIATPSQKVFAREFVTSFRSSIGAPSLTRSGSDACPVANVQKIVVTREK
jgi:hypothetical protein